MEDTHGAPIKTGGNILRIVLILIIMENTHGVDGKVILVKSATRLNPYYNGKYSWRFLLKINKPNILWS